MLTEVSPVTDLGGGLYLGGMPTAEELVAFERNGVHNILSVAKECPDDIEYLSPFVVAHFGFRDRRPMEPWLAVLALRSLGAMCERGPTFVHCGAGISRSPSIVALYWWAARKFPTVSAALSRLKLLRPVVSPHPEIFHEPLLRAVRRLRGSWSRKR